MKKVHLTCPKCHSKALLRPASVVYGNKADPNAKVYVCARYPACDSYVNAHRHTNQPMGTLADAVLRQKRRETHLELDRLWKNGLMSRAEAYRLIQFYLGVPSEDAHIGKFFVGRCEEVSAFCRWFSSAADQAAEHKKPACRERRAVMKHDFILTSEQQSLAEEHMWLVDRVIRFAIQPNEYVCGLGREDLHQEGCVALCRAATTFQPGAYQFTTYAFPVIRNYLYDYCRDIQSSRRHIPTISLECFSSDLPLETDWEEAVGQRLSEAALLEALHRFRHKYSGTARLGIEALEHKMRGYTTEEIAQCYHVKPNYIRACIARSAKKLRKERELYDIYTAYAESEARSA